MLRLALKTAIRYIFMDGEVVEVQTHSLETAKSKRRIRIDTNNIFKREKRTEAIGPAKWHKIAVTLRSKPLVRATASVVIVLWYRRASMSGRYWAKLTLIPTTPKQKHHRRQMVEVWLSTNSEMAIYLSWVKLLLGRHWSFSKGRLEIDRQTETTEKNMCPNYELWRCCRYKSVRSLACRTYWELRYQHGNRDNKARNLPLVFDSVFMSNQCKQQSDWSTNQQTNP